MADEHENANIETYLNSSRLRILHIISTIDPVGGGPIEGIIQQAQIRAASSSDISICSLDSPVDPLVNNFQIRVYPLGPTKGWPNNWRRHLPWNKYRFSSRLVPWLKANAQSFDIIIINGIWNYSALAARLALVGSRTPYVVYTHGMLDPWFKRTYPFKSMAKQLFWLFSEGPLLNNADLVCFTTEEEKILARKAFFPYHVNEHVVSYGTSLPPTSTDKLSKSFREFAPNLEQRSYVLYLSRIHKKKGCDLLIRAFAEIAKTNATLDLVMAGPDKTGWRRELEELARSLQISNRIHWTGMLVGDAKWGAYYGAEAFVLTSHQENFGIVVAEAMAAGLPVLISNKVNIWREVLAGNGGLVAEDTIDGSVELLKRFMSMTQSERLEMGQNARSVFLDKFEISKVVKSVDRQFAELVASKRTTT